MMTTSLGAFGRSGAPTSRARRTEWRARQRSSGVRRPAALAALGLLLSLLAVLAPPHAPAGAQRIDPPSFVMLVFDDIDAYWTAAFRYHRFSYRSPRRAMYWQPVLGACGSIPMGQSPASHCAPDETVYLEMVYLGRLYRDVGDFAVASVVAHEFGHHVQHLLGIHRSYSPTKPVELYPIPHELQADCLAGVWATAAGRLGRLEPGDLEEALWLAHHSGDAPGRPPTHGPGPARAEAFWHGYRNGTLTAC
jgi:predicted metalloprotease